MTNTKFVILAFGVAGLSNAAVLEDDLNATICVQQSV